MTQKSTSLFKPYTFKLGLIYLFSIAESCLEMMYPLAIGIAINGLINNQGMVSMLMLSLVWLSQALVGAIYPLLASRYAATILKDFTEKIIQSHDSSLSESTLIARVDMVEKVCDSLVEVVPSLLSGMIGIVLSTFMLFIFSFESGFLALVLITIIGGLQVYYSRKASHLSEQINTHKESQVNVFMKRQSADIRAYISRLTKIKIKFNDIATSVWAISDIVSLIVLLSLLVLIASMNQNDLGSIFAMVTYVMLLSDSLERAPILIEKIAHVYDVYERLSASIIHQKHIV